MDIGNALNILNLGKLLIFYTHHTYRFLYYYLLSLGYVLGVPVTRTLSQNIYTQVKRSTQPWDHGCNLSSVFLTPEFLWTDYNGKHEVESNGITEFPQFFRVEPTFQIVLFAIHMFWKRGAHVAGYVRCRNFSGLPKRPPNSLTSQSRSTGQIRRVSNDDPAQGPTDKTAQPDVPPHRVQYLEDVKVLGKPAHVVIMNKKPRRPQKVAQTNTDKGPWKSPAELLKDLHREKADFKLEELEENFDRLCALYSPGQSLLLNDWEHLHKTLNDGFTFEQLKKYYQNAERNTDDEYQDGWRAGISPYMDQAPAPQSRITTRIPAFKEMGPKKRLVERILRECWELSIDGEEGQLDVHLDRRPMSVLLLPTMPLMNMFAESLKVNIDVSRHLGLIRITGSKEACMETSRQLHEWASDVRSMDIDLPVAHLKSRADMGYWENTLLPWIQSEYNVSLDINWEEEVLTIHYLHGAESNAHRARQTLHLAVPPPHQQDGLLTNVSNSESAHLYPVSCPGSMKLPDRQKEWLRWIKIGEGDGRVPGRPPASIYGKGLVKPFHTLLERLFDGEDSNTRHTLDPEFTREVITATVGQCLFESAPSYNSEQVSFPDIETSQTPRIFINEVPNTLPFLDSLENVENNDNTSSFRIRLLPSRNGHPPLPELELELETVLPEDNEDVSISPRIRKVSAIVTSRDVDMLLPESPLDIRFNKTVYYCLFEPDNTKGNPHSAAADSEFLSSLHKCVEAFKLNMPLARNQPPMPLFCNLAIPKRVAALLDSSESSQSASSKTAEKTEYITGEYYIYPPVQSLAEAGVSRYIYKEFDLTFGTRNLGPYLPTKTTDISLTLGLHDDERRPQAALPNQKLSSLTQAGSTAGSLRTALLPFYLSSCHLAFGFAALQQRLDQDLLDEELFDENLPDKKLDHDP
ncbi:hypothetical protein MferCBS31731_003644 [Microsporum ferrugineum]